MQFIALEQEIFLTCFKISTVLEMIYVSIQMNIG